MQQVVKLLPRYSENSWGIPMLIEKDNGLVETKIGTIVFMDGFTNVLYSNGKKKSIDFLLKNNPEIFSNTKIPCLPIMIKMILSSMPLSIQVHPNDRYALRQGILQGKDECWYILNSNSESKILLGSNKENKNEFIKSFKKINIENYKNIFNFYNAEIGDYFSVPSGVVHAIGSNIKLLEVQQNCSITYRLYDYDSSRELHIHEGLDCVNLTKKVKHFNKKTFRDDFESFSVEKIVVNKEKVFDNKTKNFVVLVCLKGNGTLYQNKNEMFLIKTYDTFLVPADSCVSILGELEIYKITPKKFIQLAY